MQGYQRNRQEENPCQISTHPVSLISLGPRSAQTDDRAAPTCTRRKRRHKKPYVPRTCAAHTSTEVEKSPWQHPPKIAQPVRSGETRQRPDHPRHICPEVGQLCRSSGFADERRRDIDGRHGWAGAGYSVCGAVQLFPRDSLDDADGRARPGPEGDHPAQPSPMHQPAEPLRPESHESDPVCSDGRVQMRVPVKLSSVAGRSSSSWQL
jgi:hypothetical protein